ncbi:MAG: hypothetical protein ACYTHN_24825, partial [Planctomycetota bacterium]
MNRTLVIIVAACLPALTSTGLAEEGKAESRIVRLGLFKNGLAVVSREVKAKGAGTFVLEDLPEPLHGTFWVESSCPVHARLTEREVEAPFSLGDGVDFQTQLAGRKVTIHFRDGSIPPATGSVADLPSPKRGRPWNRSYGSAGRAPRHWSATEPMGPPPAAFRRFLVLQTEKGPVFVDTSMIALVRSEGGGVSVKRRVRNLELTVPQPGEKEPRIFVSYLTRGIAWAPSYKFDLREEGVLDARMKAVIRNERAAFEDVEVELISGFPNIQFSHVASPLSPATTWTRFFQALNTPRSRWGNFAGQQLAYQQAIASNIAMPSSPADLGATPMGEGPDIHHQNVGKLSAGEGDTLLVPVARASAKYERIVEWIVPDTRHWNGRIVSVRRGRTDPDKNDGTPW